MLYLLARSLIVLTQTLRLEHIHVTCVQATVACNIYMHVVFMNVNFMLC